MIKQFAASGGVQLAAKGVALRVFASRCHDVLMAQKGLPTRITTKGF